MNSMNDWTHLFMNLTIVFCFIAFALIGKYGWMRPTAVGKPATETWLENAVNECNTIISRITVVIDKEVMKAIECDIEAFENKYALLVSLEDVQEMTVRMYQLLQERKDKLNPAMTGGGATMV